MIDLPRGPVDLLPDGSLMEVRTNRIGLMSIHAKAPVTGGALQPGKSGPALHFSVRIDHIDTGNHLLDPELHALIHQVTDGVLVYAGIAAGSDFVGTAQAGKVTVPLTLAASVTAHALSVNGRADFDDVRLPLPGLSHIRQLSVHVSGTLRLPGG